MDIRYDTTLEELGIEWTFAYRKWCTSYFCGFSPVEYLGVKSAIVAVKLHASTHFFGPTCIAIININVLQDQMHPREERDYKHCSLVANNKIPSRAKG